MMLTNKPQSRCHPLTCTHTQRQTKRKEESLYANIKIRIKKMYTPTNKSILEHRTENKNKKTKNTTRIKRKKNKKTKNKKQKNKKKIN
jgi:hypothetical protein